MRVGLSLLCDWPMFRLGSAKPTAGVIIEGKKLSEDEEEDDEQFVVEEAVPSDVAEVQAVSDLTCC